MKTRIRLGFLVIAMLVLSACAQSTSVSTESSGPPSAEIMPRMVSSDPGLTQAATVVCSRNSDETRLLVNAVHGYCLQYPPDYDLFYPNESEIMLFKRSVLNTSEPAVSIKVQPAGDLTIEQAADNIAQTFAIPGMVPIREHLTIDGEAAIMLDGLSGQDPNRQLVVEHNDRLYSFFFVEMNKNQPELRAQYEKLYSTIIQSFNFNPESNPCPGCAELNP